MVSSQENKHPPDKTPKRNFTKPFLDQLKNDILICFQRNSSIEDAYRCAFLCSVVNIIDIKEKSICDFKMHTFEL